MNADVPAVSNPPREKSLVVSIHDVSPETRHRCELIISALSSLGIPRASLLVIPDHHEHGHILGDAAFSAWLKAQVAAGHEPVVHGYTHLRKARDSHTLRERLLTQSYSAGEGEFFDLSYDEARTLAARGRAELRELGLDPQGFVAPIWLLNKDAERAVRDLGYAYTTRLQGIWDFRRDVVHSSHCLCWSLRAVWRRALGLAWNANLFHRLEDASLLRIAVHPVDYTHPHIWRQISQMIVAALRTRTPRTYAQWLA